ncbi:MAG: sensor histidine kinase, partial [Candidatus Coproplasma sp.]
LTGRLKTVGLSAAAVSGLAVAVAIIAALAGAILIYDTAIYWVIVQTAVNVTLIGCCAAEICKNIKTSVYKLQDFKKLTLPIVCILTYMALTVDFILTWVGVWQGGFISIWVFGVLFVFALIVALKVIPSNYRSSIREKEMRAELQEKRIALTRSQIQPHFLFNTLSSIAELCVTDPDKAQEATVEFTEYLRGNLNAMNNPKPISFVAELEHVKNYLALEKMRFGEYLQVVYDIRDTGFLLPPLSVQPLVENAVKHGIGMKESGGTIKIITYSDEDNFYVIVSDDGVGFDSTQEIEKGHIGIENVRYRLSATCKATLEINGIPDEGTVCKITVPKEESK